MMFSIMTFSTRALSIMTLSTMTLRIMTICNTKQSVSHQYRMMCRLVRCRYPECRLAECDGVVACQPMFI
jgi:hypothetical protein